MRMIVSSMTNDATCVAGEADLPPFNSTTPGERFCQSHNQRMADYNRPAGTALATFYYTQEKYDLAEPLYKRAITILDSALGESHPNTILFRKNLALMKTDREAAGK